MTNLNLHRTKYMKYNIERLRVLTLREISGTLGEMEREELESILKGSDEALKIWSQVHDDMENGQQIQPATLKRHIPRFWAWLISVFSRREPMRWVVLITFLAFKTAILGALFYSLGQKWAAKEASRAKKEHHQPVIVARSAAGNV